MSGVVCKECGRYGPFVTDWCPDCMEEAYVTSPSEDSKDAEDA